MIVTLKNLQDDKFTVEIDPSQTVKHFKEKIEKVKGDAYPAKNIKLMYAGKFLVDNKKVCDYNVEEKKFLIIVVKKPKPATVVKEEQDGESSSEVTQSSSQGRIFAHSSRNITDEALIAHIVELGFDRADVEAAMNVSYNNPDRAVEYLLSTALPSSSNDEDAEMEDRRQNPDHISDPDDAALLRQISEPRSISPSMPNQEQIMDIFANAVEESERDIRVSNSIIDETHELLSMRLSDLEAAELEAAANGVGLGPRSPRRTCSSPFSPSSSLSDSSTYSSGMFDFSTVFTDAQSMNFGGNLSDRDHEAIERLKALGFSDHKAIEAYFVCDRNENAAADYLFSQKFE